MPHDDDYPDERALIAREVVIVLAVGIGELVFALVLTWWTMD